MTQAKNATLGEGTVSREVYRPRHLDGWDLRSRAREGGDPIQRGGGRTDRERGARRSDAARRTGATARCLAVVPLS